MIAKSAAGAPVAPDASLSPAIDLNADLGEGFGIWRLGDDQAILDAVSSANIACGFHAGDPATIERTVRAAAARGVAVGAHVAYPDRVGFGRRDLDVSPDELYCDVLYQIGALDAFARAAGTRVSYVKPHGALYHRVCVDQARAEALARAMGDYDRSLVLLALPDALALSECERLGLGSVAEAYCDRAYLPDGRLADRRTPGSVLTDVAVVVERALRIALDNAVPSVDGSEVAVAAGSICLHGDTPGAAGIAREVRRGLELAGVRVAAFAAR